MDEVLRGAEIATEGRPKVVGVELLAEERGHGGGEVVEVKVWEGVVGGFYGIESLWGVEGVAVVHFSHSRGNCGAGAKGYAPGGTPLGSDGDGGGVGGRGEKQLYSAGFGKFLHEVEIFAALQGGDASHFFVSPKGESHSTA